MRHFYILAFSALLLTSCSCIENETKTNEEHIKDYEDYAQYTIGWNSLFEMGKGAYHVYVFNKTCGHCNRIKEKIFSLADVAIPYFYFCEYSEEVPVKSCSSNTIGVSKLKDAYICGTPSLIIINKSKITQNLCGENAITTYIEDYINRN